MPASPDDTPKARLFAAVDLPDEIRDGLGAWIDRELADPALRPVPAPNLHVTLCFLGSVSVARIAAIARDVQTLPDESFRMRFESEVALRPPSRPRIVAAQVESEPLRVVQAQLSRRLEAGGVYEREARPYWSHVTLARVRNEPKRRRPRRLASPPNALPASITEPFDAVRIALYRSNIRSDGAHYESLANLDLKPAT